MYIKVDRGTDDMITLATLLDYGEIHLTFQLYARMYGSDYITVIRS